MKKTWVLLGVLAMLLILTHQYRREIMIWFYIQDSTGAPPPLLDPVDQGDGVVWLDDYFTVQKIAENTYAIGEPRYAQQNFSYLIVGTERAILFDAGPGLQDISSIAKSLTQLPITFFPSHFHYDHVGNGIVFDSVAIVDLPYIRKRAQDNQLTPTKYEHLGAPEGFTAPTFNVTQWWQPGEVINLGNRQLEVVHTPGHTKDSVSLLDREAAILFSGDYLYPGDLYAFLPGSSVQDYLNVAMKLRTTLRLDVQIYGAHRASPPGAPKLDITDLAALEDALAEMRNGTLKSEGGYIKTYPVNDRIKLLAEPGWLLDFD